LFCTNKSTQNRRKGFLIYSEFSDFVLEQGAKEDLDIIRPGEPLEVKKIPVIILKMLAFMKN